jgi:hypothetical protein
VSRRTLAAGAAWSVPVIAVGAAAPAFAASLCPTIPAFSAANGWTLGTTGTGAGSARFANGTYVVDTDAAMNSTYTATASRPLSVVAGVRYTFLLSFTAYVVNARPMTLTLAVNGVALSPSPLVDTSTLAVNNGSTTSHTSTRTATYVAPTSGTVTLALTDSITSTLTTVGDDITVTSLAVSCA